MQNVRPPTHKLGLKKHVFALEAVAVKDAVGFCCPASILKSLACSIPVAVATGKSIRGSLRFVLRTNQPRSSGISSDALPLRKRILSNDHL